MFGFFVPCGASIAKARSGLAGICRGTTYSYIQMLLWESPLRYRFDRTGGGTAAAAGHRRPAPGTLRCEIADGTGETCFTEDAPEERRGAEGESGGCGSTEATGITRLACCPDRGVNPIGAEVRLFSAPFRPTGARLVTGATLMYEIRSPPAEAVANR